MVQSYTEFKVKLSCPRAYFKKQQHCQQPPSHDLDFGREWLTMKQLYDDMKNQIELIVEKGCVPDEVKDQHKGFLEWNHGIAKGDHQLIVEIIIDGRDKSAVDDSGCRLPTLVYVAREKRTNYFHNFKAGAMNALDNMKKLVEESVDTSNRISKEEFCVMILGIKSSYVKGMGRSHARHRNASLQHITQASKIE